MYNVFLFLVTRLHGLFLGHPVKKRKEKRMQNFVVLEKNITFVTV